MTCHTFLTRNCRFSQYTYIMMSMRYNVSFYISIPLVPLIGILQSDFIFLLENCWAKKHTYKTTHALYTATLYNSLHSHIMDSYRIYTSIHAPWKAYYTYKIKYIKEIFWENAVFTIWHRKFAFHTIPIVIKRLCWWLFSTHGVDNKGVLQLISKRKTTIKDIQFFVLRFQVLPTTRTVT